MKLTRVNPVELRRHGVAFIKELEELEDELEQLLEKHGYRIAYHYELESLSIDEEDVELIEREMGRKPLLTIPLVKTMEPRDGLYRAIVLEDSEVVLVRTRLTNKGVEKDIIRLE